MKLCCEPSPNVKIAGSYTTIYPSTVMIKQIPMYFSTLAMNHNPTFSHFIIRPRITLLTFSISTRSGTVIDRCSDVLTHAARRLTSRNIFIPHITHGSLVVKCPVRRTRPALILSAKSVYHCPN